MTQERTIKVTLLDGSIVTMNTEERVISYQLASQMIPLTTDADSVFDDVIEALAEAQQTIARQREALKLIADMKIVGSSHVSMQAIARGELNRETQIVQKCERCGCNYVKKDDSYVCGVCLDELEEEEGEQP